MTNAPGIAKFSDDVNLWPWILPQGGCLDFDSAPDCWEKFAHVQRYAFACKIFKNARVLDFGCGVGYGSEMLAEEGNTVTGVDSSLEALERARSRRGTIEFMRAPLEGRQFDGVVAFEVIEHLESPIQFIMQSPARQLVCSVPIIPTVTRNPHHKHDFTLAGFMALLANRFVVRSRWVQVRPYHVEPDYGVFQCEERNF